MMKKENNISVNNSLNQSMLPPVNFKKIFWGEGAENHEPIPKIAWLYWDGKIVSPLVKLCIQNMQTYLPDFKIRILNKNTLKDFLPDAYLEMRNDLPLANFTDLVRLNLLEEYGGIWLDASIMLTENLDWAFLLKSTYNADLVGFYSDLITADFNNPILETWFLAAPKKSKIIVDWHAEFRKCYYSPNPHVFYLDIKNDPAKRQNLIADWLFDYLIAYQSAINVMHSSKDYRILMISANDMAHFYNFNLKINGKNLTHYFLKEKTPKHYPKIIKFEKNGRYTIDTDINLGRYNKNSYLFSISKEPNFIFNKVKRRCNYIQFICNNLIRKYLK